jgi:hypothetical protein
MPQSQRLKRKTNQLQSNADQRYKVFSEQKPANGGDNRYDVPFDVSTPPYGFYNETSGVLPSSNYEPKCPYGFVEPNDPNVRWVGVIGAHPLVCKLQMLVTVHRSVSEDDHIDRRSSRRMSEEFHPNAYLLPNIRCCIRSVHVLPV